MDRIKKITEMLTENPGDSFLCHALALEYIKLGNDGDARKLFESIVENEPGYIGTYYHLAKLLERMGETDAAVKVYEKGMEEANKVGDNHSLSELRSAFEELTF
jgi:tetratricopeptide (TPR) repeat protein